MGFSWTIAAVLTVAAVAAATTGVAEGQSECVSQLVPCAEYLNSTSPSQQCCSAIQRVVSTQLPCLCRLYKNPSAFPGVNFTQALEIPAHCGLSAHTSACNDIAMAPGSSSTHPPPETPGGERNGASTSSSWATMSTLLVLISLLLVQVNY